MAYLTKLVLLINISLFAIAQEFNNQDFYVQSYYESPFFNQDLKREAGILNKTPQDSNTTLIGRWIDGSCEAITVANGILYAGQGKSIVLFDVSNPNKPIMLSQLALADKVNDIFVSDNFAYVANNESGLRVIDISSPTNPNEIGFLQSEGSAIGVCTRGDYAYLAAGTAGLRIIDISNPNTLYEIAYFDTNTIGTAKNIVVSGNYAYLAYWNSTPIILDISNPFQPTAVGPNLPLPLTDDLFIVDNYAYLAGDDGLYCFDVINPTYPNEIGFLEFPLPLIDIYVSGDYAYVTNNFRLSIVDISSPENMELITDTLTGNALKLYTVGSELYLADGSNGFRIYDVTVASLPIELYLFPMLDATMGIYYNNGLAYVANNVNGLKIFDLTTPEQPIVKGSYTRFRIDALARAVTVVGNYAYLAYSGVGLVIIDVSDPTFPEEISIFEIDEIIQGVFINNNLAYIASEEGLYIIDISSPSTPIEISFLQVFNMRKVFIDNNIAYAACEGAGLKIIDISIPSNPVEIGNYVTEGITYDVLISDNLAYISDGPNGLRILDVTIPSSPQEIGFFEHFGDVWSTKIHNNYAYLTGFSLGFLIIDITDKSAPIEVACFNTEDNFTTESAVNQNLIYLIGHGMYVIKNDLINGINVYSEINMKIELNQNYPNPFNPATKIKYSIPQTDHVTLQIYDILGNQIKTLVDEEKSPGNYEVEFRAEGLPSGIYIYRLSSGKFSESKKLVFIK